ncbi:MAG: DUF5681 domain-containing protein [Nanoarchaeota archaeon]
MPYKKGECGNPNGRPKGSLNKTTRAAHRILYEKQDKIIRRAITLALDKNAPNTVLLAKLLDKVLPSQIVGTFLGEFTQHVEQISDIELIRIVRESGRGTITKKKK